MKILILTCKFGMGHYAAAKAIQDKIVENFPNIKIGSVDLKDYYMRTPKKFVKDFLREMKNFARDMDSYIEDEIVESEYISEEDEVKIVDLFELAYPEFIDIFYKIFSVAIDKGAKLYNLIYKKSDYIPASERKLFEIIYSHILGSVGKLLIKEKPTIIISSFSICSEIIADYKRFSGSNIPLITAITDIIPHISWLNDNTDYYTVASEKTRKSLIENGVPEEKICITGMPIVSKFVKIKDIDVKNNLQYKKLLIMGGGLGLIPKDIEFYEKLDEIEGLKTTVITAKNKRMYNKLQGRFNNVEIIGYCDNVDERMLESDLLLSKSGGITTFEAIYAKIPMIVFKPFLMQEVSNAEFIKENAIGKVINEKMKNAKNSIDDIIELIFDENKLNYMRNNMKEILSHINENSMMKLLKTINESQREEEEKGNKIKVKKVNI